MLSACNESFPNPHRNCVREIMRTLLCNKNDLQRLDIQLRNTQCEFEEEMGKLKFGSNKINNIDCDFKDNTNFPLKINTMYDLNDCFSKKMEKLKNKREEVINHSRQCILDLNVEKCKFKQFHEKTIDYWKRYAIKSNDSAKINNCEKNICEMYRLFVKEVSFIKRCETELQYFFQLCGLPGISTCCCFRDYDWLPKGKDLYAVDGLVNQMKCLMNTSIIRAFASLHTQQTFDPKQFFATYLMNLEQNEDLILEKLNIFGNLS